MAEAVMSGMISRFLEDLRNMEQIYNMAVSTEAEERSAAEAEQAEFENLTFW